MKYYLIYKDALSFPLASFSRVISNYYSLICITYCKKVQDLLHKYMQVDS